MGKLCQFLKRLVFHFFFLNLVFSQSELIFFQTIWAPMVPHKKTSNAISFLSYFLLCAKLLLNKFIKLT